MAHHQTGCFGAAHHLLLDWRVMRLNEPLEFRKQCICSYCPPLGVFGHAAKYESKVHEIHNGSFLVAPTLP